MRSSRGPVMMKKKKMNSSGKKGGARPGKTSHFRKEKKPRAVSSDSESSQEVASSPGKSGNNVTDDSDSARNSEAAASDRKRRLDVFEFDEYDASDVKKMKKESLQISSKLTGKGRNPMKSELGSSKHVKEEDKGKHSSSDESSAEGEEEEEEEAQFQKFKYRTNGVLNVKMSKNKADTPHKGKNSETAEEFRKGKNHKKLKEESPQSRSSSRAKSGGKTPSSQKTPSIGSGKNKRGRATEKQLLREKIKKMLIEAGWTIDYRPRKNRDYLDAVYINPSGTGFWSITKAYDALQKQSVEEDDVKVKRGDNSDGFTSLPDGLISKLTRQTRKKIEREMKKSSDDDDDGDDEKEEISDSLQGRKNRKMGRCTLLARSSDEHRTSESDNYIPYRGKRTVLHWLVESGTVHLSEKVKYMNRRQTKVLLKGWIAKDGIHCGCCSKIISVHKFENHAGSKLRQPFQNIVLGSGSSLLKCQIDAWNMQEESKRHGFHAVHTDSDDPNDDTCCICGDGGDLICCDGCPSTFHQSCLGLKALPDGDWHCPNCTCNFCGVLSENAPEDDSTSDSALFRCNLCEKRYHESCVEGIIDLTMSFCGKDCKRIFDRMEKLLGVKHDLEEGFSWSLIRRSDILDIDERKSGSWNKVESNSKLAVALSVMDECFLPIVDRRSGFNIIHNVVYNCGSNFSRLDYSGFYTTILEKGDEIIAAASIRIHGTQLAEMPFIGTRHMYRRQGMCRRLLSAIESVLRSMKVNRLVIPAISEHMRTWKMVFGFDVLDKTSKQEMKLLNMLVFPRVDMLQKRLLEDKSNITDSSVGQELPVCDNEDDEMDDKDSVDDDDNDADADEMNDKASVDDADEMNDKTSVDDADEMNDKASVDDADEMNDKALVDDDDDEINDKASVEDDDDDDDDDDEMNDKASVDDDDEMNDKASVDDDDDDDDDDEMNDKASVDDDDEMNGKALVDDDDVTNDKASVGQELSECDKDDDKMNDKASVRREPGECDNDEIHEKASVGQELPECNNDADEMHDKASVGQELPQCDNDDDKMNNKASVGQELPQCDNDDDKMNNKASVGQELPICDNDEKNDKVLVDDEMNDKASVGQELPICDNDDEMNDKASVGQELPQCDNDDDKMNNKASSGQELHVDDDQKNVKASTEASTMQEAVAVIPSFDTTESRSQVIKNSPEDKAKPVLVESISCPSEAPAPVPDSETAATRPEENGTKSISKEIESQREQSVSSDAKSVSSLNANNMDNISNNIHEHVVNTLIDNSFPNGVSVSPHHKTDENSLDCIPKLNQTSAHDGVALASKLPLTNGVSTSGESSIHLISSPMDNLSCDDE